MSEDFGYCWRTVRLYCPAAPTFLAREWVNAAWKQLLAARRWGFMRAQVTLYATPMIPIASRLNLMRLNASRLGYTSCPRTTLSARLNVMRLQTAPLAYAGLGLTSTCDPDMARYVTLPADFASFVVVGDPSRQLRLCFRYNLEELLRADPALNGTGPPLALCATTPDPATGLPRYRLVPGGVATTLWAVYNRQGARLVDGEPFTGVLADGAEVLVAGALAQAALWPGTGDKPNPYFNAGLAQAKAAEFRLGIQMLSLRDDEQYPDDLWDSWEECCGSLGVGDLRTTDASSLSGTWYTGY